MQLLEDSFKIFKGCCTLRKELQWKAQRAARQHEDLK